MTSVNFKDFVSDDPEIKYHAAKTAIRISAAKPEALYPKLDFFIKLLDGDNNVLMWTAIIIIGNLARADKKGRVERLIPRFFSFLRGPEMITANNTSKALAKIAMAKPKRRKGIFRELLKIEKGKFINKGKISPECRNIAIGCVIDAFGQFPDDVRNDKHIMAFIKKQTRNSRHSVRVRAVALYNRLSRVG